MERHLCQDRPSDRNRAGTPVEPDEGRRVVDEAVLARLRSLGRLLVDSGDMTPQGLSVLLAVLADEAGKRVPR